MDRVPTGIAEPDEILAGGLPAGSLGVLAGPPGTGKTILAQQLAFAVATEASRTPSSRSPTRSSRSATTSVGPSTAGTWGCASCAAAPR